MGEGLGFVRVTPIQIIPNQWDYPPLLRNQTHSLSRRLELPVFALTFLCVPAFLNPNTRKRETTPYAHGRTQDSFHSCTSHDGLYMRRVLWDTDINRRLYQEKRMRKHNAVRPLRHREGLLPTSTVTPPANHWGRITVFYFFYPGDRRTNVTLPFICQGLTDCMALKSCLENMDIWRAPHGVIGHTEPLSLSFLHHILDRLIPCALGL